jgi:hypothetical protein
MLQTVSDITAAQRAKLDVAARYEALLGQRAQLQRTIENREAAAVNLDPLRKIYELCGDVPKTILTKGASSLGFTIPDYAELRGLLIQVVAGALSRENDREAERAASLVKAQITLAAVEVELSELERTNS